MIKHVLISMLVLIAVSGCQLLQTLSDGVTQSPVLSYIAVQQSVARYIQAGNETERAQHVMARADTILAFVDGNPLASPGEILEVFKASVDMDKLSVADRLLVNDLIMFVEQGIKSATPTKKPELVGINDMIKTAKQTAEIFLSSR